MKNEEYKYGIPPKQYGSLKTKSEDSQDISTRLLYDLIRKQKVSNTCTLSDLISNYNLQFHIMDYISL